MNTPTMDRFNNWSDQDKLFWINYETGGEKGEPDTPGFIFYSNYAIRYMHDRKGRIVDAKCINLSDAIKEAKRAGIAVNAMGNTN
jgi:hypothetical protein